MATPLVLGIMGTALCGFLYALHIDLKLIAAVLLRKNQHVAPMPEPERAEEVIQKSSRPEKKMPTIQGFRKAMRNRELEVAE